MELRFHTLDVFTDRVFGGNPLAVFPDAAGLDDRLMQRIARELNLSETVFLSPPERGGDRRVRIFTPAVEVPFAGHPTVGAAWFLASSGGLGPQDAPDDDPGGGARTIVLEENVGDVPVEVRWKAGRPRVAWFTPALDPEVRPAGIPPADLARMVGLEPGDVGTRLPLEGAELDLAPAFASVGLPFLIVPVADAGRLAAARLDLAVWEERTQQAWSRMLYLVAPAPAEADAELRTRMFGPSVGVPEDPATGSAAAALAGYLALRLVGRAPGRRTWVLEQGVEMGRPSRIEIETNVDDGRVGRLRVGGAAVAVSEGVMRVEETSR